MFTSTLGWLDYVQSIRASFAYCQTLKTRTVAGVLLLSQLLQRHA